MFVSNFKQISNFNKIGFSLIKLCFIHRLINEHYNDYYYDIFFLVGDILLIEVLRTENKHKSILKHATVHRYIGRVIAKYNKGINSSFYNS